MDILDVRELCLSLPQSEETTPFDETTLVYKVAGKMFLLADMTDGRAVNVKCDPDHVIALRERYAEVTPGWHMNKRHWNTVRIDGDLPEKFDPRMGRRFVSSGGRKPAQNRARTATRSAGRMRRGKRTRETNEPEPMKKLFLLTLALLAAATAGAQIHLEGYRQSDIAPRWTEGRWSARWISVPGEPLNAYGVYVFRKTLNLPSKPERYVVHVSADNRYAVVSMSTDIWSVWGCLRRHLQLELRDGRPVARLRQGDNTLAAEVWNFVEWKPIAQISFNQTGLIVQATAPTSRAPIRTAAGNACVTTPMPPTRPESTDTSPPDPASGSTRRATHGAGSNRTTTACMAGARVWMEGAAKGARDYPGPAARPDSDSAYGVRRRTVSRACANRKTLGFPTPFRARPLRSPFRPAPKARTTCLDNDSLSHHGLIRCRCCSAADGLCTHHRRIRRSALYGHRPAVERKPGRDRRQEIRRIRGRSSGPTAAATGRFTSLWWRTWRYVQLTIETKDEPLENAGDVYGTFTAYPFERAPTVPRTGTSAAEPHRSTSVWRTARLCANEHLHGLSRPRTVAIFRRHADSGAHYALQYARPGTLARNAIEQGRQSIVSDGITMSRYPSGHSPVHLVVLALLDMHGTRLLALPGRAGIPENASAGIPGSVVVVRRLSERATSRSHSCRTGFSATGHRISEAGEPFPARRTAIPRSKTCCLSWDSKRPPTWRRLSAYPRTGNATAKRPRRSSGRSRRNIGMPNAACSPTRATGATIRSMSTCWRS